MPAARFPEALTAAGYEPGSLTFIPRTAIHPYMVTCDAWLDEGGGILMFVGVRGADASRFLYYIGEEHNRDVTGIGPGISAWVIDEDRIEWLRGRLK